MNTHTMDHNSAGVGVVVGGGKQWDKSAGVQ